jgi:diguanylate cyclase (GGDEF)-like protein/PAS domain S-box-containing protein
VHKTGFGRIRGFLGEKPGEHGRAPTLPAAGSAQEMRQAMLLLRDYERSGSGWFWSSDEHGRIAYISGSAAQKLGKASDELVGTPFQSIFNLERDVDDDPVGRTLPLVMNARKTFSELALRAGAGEEEIWWAISGRPQFDANGEFTGFLGNGTDITVVRRSQRDASRLAMFDSLTGLTNRHQMGKRLAATLTAYKAAKRACALMMIDLDRFKQVNDTLGHPAGDELLKQVAQRLKRIIPEGGREIGRLGGDEFQVVLPDVDDRGKLGDIARKIIEAVSQPYSVDGSRCVIGASVGVAIAPYDGIDADELTRSADLALYAAKGGGRGQFRFYSSELHREAERRRQIEDDLRDALINGELSLAYQPVVDVKTNEVAGVEAVMRWEHPELGNVPPSIFIPIAEETSLIGPMGDWALKQACQDIAKLPGHIRVAVNVSPAQFSNTSLPQVVTQALTSSGLPAERLELEVTESIFLADDELTDQMFKSLKILGVRLALDDFGTGYSALSYLKKADFDKIKIDQGFIRGVTEPGSRNVAIIKSVVSLAEGLNMETTAEGIEALDELQMMNDLGVGYIQGYIYSRPLPYADVEQALASGEWVIEPSGPSKFRHERMTVLRKIGLIHEDHRYDVMMRNLSRTGCLIEGLLDVPVGTQFVIDLGEGQLGVASVKRSAGSLQGMEFETPLVDDGAGGLCTRNRVSPYVLASAGMPLASLPSGHYPLSPGGTHGPASFSMPKFAQVNESGKKAVRAG